MGAQLRVYRRRIRSVQATKKITKAMELIAASRIVKAQQRMNSARPYADELSHALAELSGDTSLDNPMLTGVPSPRRAGILVITSDRGLAGGYNANALRAANDLAAQLARDEKEVVRYVIGRKGTSFYAFRNVPVAGVWTGFSEEPNFVDARGATETVVSALSATSENPINDGSDNPPPGIDELYLVYTRFVNSVTQTATALKISPVSQADEQPSSTLRVDSSDNGAAAASAHSGDAVSYEFEPDANELVSTLLPQYIGSRIYSALLESAASESAARRRAMKSASDNATELIRNYTRLANQARQAEITQEISEIVGGADALAATGTDD